MAINYGLLDTTLPEKLGAIPGNALAKYAQTRMQMDDRALEREHAGTRNALAKMQLGQGQRAMDEEDAFKAALARVQNGDYEAARGDLMGASPARTAALFKGLADEKKAVMDAQLKRFEVIDRVAGQFAANPTRQMGVWVLSQLAANGTPPAVIQEMSAKLNAASDADLPKMAQAFLAATQEGINAQTAALYPKPAAPSDLSRLMSERDALPPGDPRRAAYDQAIRKATTHPPVQPTPATIIQGPGGQELHWDPRAPNNPAAPIIGPDGKPVVAPTPADKAAVAADAKRAKSAESALNLLDEAEKWLDKATGSYVGAARDAVTRAVGTSTKASQAAARLKVIQGALMMNQPRMEGPQSDKDVALYREMAGRIGDPTVPAAEKKAAIDTIRSINLKYAPQSVAPAGMDSMPPPAGHVGKTITDTSTGIDYRSDGRSWVRVQ